MAAQEIPLMLLGEERTPHGGLVVHAVPFKDRTNSALCGTRVRVRRTVYPDPTLPIYVQCPICRPLREQLLSA